MATSASAFVRDTIRHRIKGVYPIEFTSDVDVRPTEYKNSKGETISKQVHSTFAVYHDTIRTVVIERDTLYFDKQGHLVDTLNLSGGSHLHISLGGGYGSLNYNLSDIGKVHGSLTGLVQLEYAYFFTDNWGLSAGLSLSNTTSIVSLNGDRTWTGISDSDGETYNHTVSINGWKERETVHALSIPIAAQYKTYFGKKRYIGMYADLGVSANLHIYNKFNILRGQVEDKAYYPLTDLTLRQVHEFQVRDMAGKGDLKVMPIGLGVFADLGLLFHVSKHTDLSVGGYFKMTPTDINRSTRTDLGFGNETFSFMPEYTSAFATTEAGASRPWEAGVKVGVRVNVADRHLSDKERENLRRKVWTKSDTTQIIIRRTERVEEHESKANTQIPSAYQQSRKTKVESQKTKNESPTYNEDYEEDIDETQEEDILTQQSTQASRWLSTTKKTTLTPKKSQVRVSSNTSFKTAKHYKYHLLFFGVNSAALSKQAQIHLDQIAETLLANPDKHVIINGYACEIGSDERNMEISQERANAVANYLEELGIDPQRMRINYYGNTRTTQTERKQMWKDRRVVVKVSL